MVFTECFDEPSLGRPEWTTTLAFVEAGGETTMTSVCMHPSVEMRDGRLHSGLEKGAVEMRDRLAEYLRGSL